MSKKFLLTAFSKDRPGIVADLSRVIYENGYNLEDSSMTNLAGEFAILLLLSAPSVNGVDAEEKLSSECRRLERDKGITAYIRPVRQEMPKQKSNILTKTIHVEGLDQAGIVYKVSQFLADNGINISTLNTKMRLSPESGAAIYIMTIVVEIPTQLSLLTVEDGLSRIGDQLNVDVSLA
ncbi:MAG: amino acid-binding protein [Deltaproteobacteria bacterium]|nr:amino acid-binding protein [Deltaproteobacteria bacterium]